MSQSYGRVALVSDASRGIGAATVRRLAAAGWDVGFSHRCDDQSARELEKTASELGVRVVAAQADVTEAAGAASWVRQATDELGPPDAVVVCTAIARDQPLTLMREADWRSVIGTGLDGAFHLCRAALPAMMRRHSGRIVMVSSVCRVYDHVTRQDHPGIAAFTRALASQTGRFGIRVSAVVPGLAEADLTATLPGSTGAALTETIALRRFGRAAEVADLVAFLVSDEASGLSGRVVEAQDGSWP